MITKKIKQLLTSYLSSFSNIGFDFLRIMSIRRYPRFLKNKAEWLKQGGEITKQKMVLFDYTDNAGVTKGHYFHQDLLVAQLIYEHKPLRHIDIGSRIDGFVAHVAAFRVIEVADVRPMDKSVHENIKFTEANLMQPQDLGKADSVSCLHAIEHFGLGRYSDPIDINGHVKGIKNLVNLLSQGGRLYISFPIGIKDEVHFNAHRIFHPRSILAHPHIMRYMKLLRFDYVDDLGDLHINKDVYKTDLGVTYGCGIYTFEKLN